MELQPLNGLGLPLTTQNAEREIEHLGIVTISVVGAKPRMTSPQSGWANAICSTKQTAITASKTITNASTQRKPSLCR